MGRISMGYEETFTRRGGTYYEPRIFLRSSRRNERSQITPMGSRREGVCVGLYNE